MEQVSIQFSEIQRTQLHQLVVAVVVQEMVVTHLEVDQVPYQLMQVFQVDLEVEQVVVVQVDQEQ
ncbi:MAG: hypothetical protein CMK56_03760 [Proteobacteria bacterium]|nr:hypothetical protein [Pseudomonadota bacterium]